MNIKEELKTKVNLSTYYILPLLKLNISSWGEDNFIKSQVTKYGEVVVFIKNSSLAGEYYNHENYGADVDEEDGSTMIIYNIEDRWLEDYQFFLESKYSKMSSFAKQAIYNQAKANKLDWNIPTGKYVNVDRAGITSREQIVNSDAKLLALSLNEDLRRLLEKDLDVKLPKNVELISKLKEEEFISLN
jgi:hypothetical protein